MAATYDDVDIETEYSHITRDPDTCEVIKEEKFKSVSTVRQHKPDKDGKVKASEVRSVVATKLDTIVIAPNAELKAAIIEARKNPVVTQPIEEV